jgi:predicted alpha/beta-hydrolase family hydrolase
MRLGYAVRYAATESRPLGGRAILVTVGGDPGVDNVAANQVADAWEKQGAPVARYEFPASLKMIHDLIDPNQPWQQTQIVYPKLMELVEQ